MTRPPRLPKWLLATLVIGCLAAAGWLFWSDATSDGEDRDHSRSTSRDDRDLAEGVLEVPDDDDGDAPGRRGDAGRDRLDDGTGSADGSTDASDDGTASDDAADDYDEPLPAVFGNLEGRHVAIYEASAEQEAGAEELVRVGGLRVPCAGQSDAPRTAIEHDQVLAVAAVLERAGALPSVIDGRNLGDAEAGCIDDRVRSMEVADFAVVVRAGSNAGRVLAGRPASNAGAASRRASAALAAELAAQLEFATPRAPNAAARTLLARVGAIDLDGGAAIALVELPGGDSDRTVGDVAMSIVRALAVTASRASTPAESTGAAGA